MIEHRRLVAGPYRLHAAVAGAGRPGPPIVLVHGLGVSHRYLLPTLRCLAARHEVHAVDLPGFGLSLDPPGRPGLRGLAAALGDWLDAAGLQSPVLLGNSLGCHHVTALAAGGRPVRGLVLVGPTVDRAARTWVAQAGRLLRDLPREPLPPLLAAVAPAYLRAGPARLLRLFAEALDDDLDDLLHDVSAPVLVVRGDRDPIASRAWCRHLTEVADDATAVEVPGAGHALNFSHPRQLAALTEAFLGKTRPDVRVGQAGRPSRVADTCEPRRAAACWEREHPTNGDTMPGSDHGPQIKDDEQYEALRDEGMSKEKAARIANSDRSETGKRGGTSGKYEDWSKDDLYDKAQEVGIEGRSDMDKDELIDALRNH